jgi:twitching motility protein PilT
MPEIDNLLRPMVYLEASDLHLRVGIRPRYRLHGRLEEPTQVDAMSRSALNRILVELLNDKQKAQYAATHEIDFTYGTSFAGRFRCNLFHDRSGPGAVIRRIPSEIPSLSQLNLPPQIENFAHLTRGLVLITGSSGSGKSSTLAALVDTINTNYRKHIISLEDPIEYVHKNKKSVIHQRGMHHDFVDFGSGIVAALRQDPDVIMIGELRDLESIRRGLTAAETGVLVYATLHTNSASDSIDRIIDVFPDQEQAEVRMQLSQSLAGVVCQFLLERIDGKGRVPACEVLVSTPAVGSIIREGNTQDIVNVIQSGRSLGMVGLDDTLEQLVKDRTIDPKVAYVHAQSKARFASMIGQADNLAIRRQETAPTA